MSQNYNLRQALKDYGWITAPCAALGAFFYTQGLRKIGLSLLAVAATLVAFGLVAILSRPFISVCVHAGGFLRSLRAGGRPSRLPTSAITAPSQRLPQVPGKEAGRRLPGLYSETVPPLVPFAVFLGSAVSVLSKNWVFATFRGNAARFIALVLPLIPALALLLFLNLLMILVVQPPELDDRMKAHWRRILETGEAPGLVRPAEDLVDRAARCVVWWQWRR